MKKVSVGVFAILTAFVVVKSGRADIASQGYVDSQVYHLASREYVDTNFQNLNKKVTSANYTKLVDTDKISKDQLYTSLEYVDSQNVLDEKVANKLGEMTPRPIELGGQKDGTFAEWFSSEVQEPENKYPSALATKTMIEEALGDLSYNTAPTPSTTVTKPKTFISKISQMNGLISPIEASFLSSLDTDVETELMNAPTGKAVKDYVNEKISDIGGDIGNAYQLKSEKLKSTDSDARITDENKDDLYPSVAKTTNIVKNAILDLDAEPFGEEGSFIESVRQQDGKLGAAAVPFVTVINDSTKDSVVAPQTKAVKTYVDAQNALDVKKTDATMNDVAAEGTFFSTIKQTDGVVDTETTAFIDNVANNPTSTIAPQTKAVVEYAEAKANKVEKVTEYNGLTTENKETFYPSVALAEYIAQEAAKAAIKQLQAIVNVPAKCAQAEKYCVLTTNGTDFVWEVIERSTSVDYPEPSVSTDANAERMKVYTITNQ